MVHKFISHHIGARRWCDNSFVWHFRCCSGAGGKQEFSPWIAAKPRFILCQFGAFMHCFDSALFVVFRPLLNQSNQNWIHDDRWSMLVKSLWEGTTFGLAVGWHNWNRTAVWANGLMIFGSLTTCTIERTNRYSISLHARHAKLLTCRICRFNVSMRCVDKIFSSLQDYICCSNLWSFMANVVAEKYHSRFRPFVWIHICWHVNHLRRRRRHIFNALRFPSELQLYLLFLVDAQFDTRAWQQHASECIRMFHSCVFLENRMRKQKPYE